MKLSTHNANELWEDEWLSTTHDFLDMHIKSSWISAAIFLSEATSKYQYNINYNISTCINVKHNILEIALVHVNKAFTSGMSECHQSGHRLTIHAQLYMLIKPSHQECLNVTNRGIDLQYMHNIQHHKVPRGHRHSMYAQYAPLRAALLYIKDVNRILKHYSKGLIHTLIT